MIKCASVYTIEVDNAEIAANEIKRQLDEKITLLDNTVGIIMCNPEFITSGTLKAVCAGLPFETAGVTTSSQSVNECIGELMLTVFVITSDDVEFITGVTEPMGEDVNGPVREAYERATAGMKDRPTLAVIFPPFGKHAGDIYVNTWDALIPGVPIFGTCAIDDTAGFSECETICNGDSYKAALSFILFYGNITPRFMVATLPEKYALTSQASITKAVGNCVYEINNINAYQYFKNLEYIESVTYTPFIIDTPKHSDYNGVPVIRGHAGFTADGASIFYGFVDEGSTMKMLECDPADIIATTKSALEKLNMMTEVNGAVLFPCVVRRSTLLGVNKPLSELQSAVDTISSGIPYMMGYAGGEICPASVRDGAPVNRFHNYSLVILVI